MLELIKIPVLSLYYLIYLLFERWINPVFILVFFLTAIFCFYHPDRLRETGERNKAVLIIFALILYGGILFSVYTTRGIEKSRLLQTLQIIYYVGALWFARCLGKETAERQKAGFFPETSKDRDTQFILRLKYILFVVFLLSLIPILLLSPYVFARADDYVFSVYVHEIWEQTGSVLEAVKMACITVGRVYFGWQGTYSSTFLMALQPGVFKEDFYGVVPAVFILLLSLSGWFFLRTVLQDLLKADKNSSGVIILMYLFMAIQCIPVKQSAFFWYNGAIHYIGSYSILLCMLALMLRMVLKKGGRINLLGAALAAIYVGGGNYVTGVGTIFLTASILLVITLTRSWRKYYQMGIVCVLFFIGFGINSIAPGNFDKMAITEGYGIIEAGILAFKTSLEYMLGKWMHWTVFALVLFSIPLFWEIVKGVGFSFSYPLLVMAYSWCYMAALFFAPLYTTSTATAGRYLNIMYLQWILLLLINTAYLTGWFQRKYCPDRQQLFPNKVRYLKILAVTVILLAGITALGKPKQYTSAFALKTLADDNLKEYGRAYWKNVEVLQSEEKDVVLDPLNQIPELLNPEEADEWHSGIRLYYGKETINFTKENDSEKEYMK